MPQLDVIDGRDKDGQSVRSDDDDYSETGVLSSGKSEPHASEKE